MRNAVLLAALVAAAVLVSVVESSQPPPPLPSGTGAAGGRRTPAADKPSKKSEKKSEKKSKDAVTTTTTSSPGTGRDELRSNANTIRASTGDSPACSGFQPLFPKEATTSKEGKEAKFKVCLRDGAGFLVSRKMLQRSATLGNMLGDISPDTDAVVPILGPVTSVAFRLAMELAKAAEKAEAPKSGEGKAEAPKSGEGKAEAPKSEVGKATDQQYAAIKTVLDKVAYDATPGQGMDAVIETLAAVNFLDMPVVLDGLSKWIAKVIIEPNKDNPANIRELMGLANDLSVEEKQQLATKYGTKLPASELVPPTTGGSTSTTTGGSTSTTSGGKSKEKKKEKKDKTSKKDSGKK